MRTEGRLRWAIFTNSVVSDVDNPDAHLWRALGRLLRRHGHVATFFEPRGNDAVRALLRRSGSQALSEFRDRHPDIEYRTLEPRRGADLVDWMSRTLATADVALISASASDDLIGWLGKFTRPHLQTFVVDTGWNGSPANRSELGERIADFSAIALGHQQLEDTYRQTAPDVPIVQFGPLSLPDGLNDDEIEVACQRLMDEVVTARVDTSRLRYAPISRNGHRPD